MDYVDYYNRICNVLKDILSNNPNSWSKRTNFRALLNDYYSGQYKIIANLIYQCVEERIPHQLCTLRTCSIEILNMCIKRIINAYGLSKDKAIFAISIWIEAFGIKCEYDYMNEVANVIDELSYLFVDEDLFGNVKIQNYSNGYIKYYDVNTGVSITEISYLNMDIIPAKSVVVIPESIEGNKVVSICPDSLNELRSFGYKYIILPNTLVKIGEKCKRLFENLTVKRSRRPELYYSFVEYSLITDKGFVDSHLDNELFAYELDNDELYIEDVVDLKIFAKRGKYFDYWEIPENCIWKSGDIFYRYTGFDDELFVDCKTVYSRAFYNSHVNKIVFSPRTTYFAKDMIINCKELKSIEFLSEAWCFFDTFSIRNCPALNDVKWPRLIDNKNVSIYSDCPLLGDMKINNVLMTCKSMDEICVVDEDVQVINSYAFKDSGVKILIIPKSVDEIAKDAFMDSNIKVLIIEGMYTKWTASYWGREETYLYADQNSYAIHYSLYSIKGASKCYLKNLSLLNGCFGNNRNLDKIKSIVYENMDCKSDPDLLQKKVDYSDEIKTQGILAERTNSYLDMMITPSSEGSQLGENYNPDKYEKKPEKVDYYNMENTGKYGYGLGNSDKIQ